MVERQTVCRNRGETFVVGIQRQPERGQQPAANVRVHGRHGGRRRVGAFVEAAHRVDELERRRARLDDALADRTSPPGVGEERDSGDRRKLQDREGHWRARQVRPERSRVPVIELIPEDRPRAGWPECVHQELDVPRTADPAIGERRRTCPPYGVA